MENKLQKNVQTVEKLSLLSEMSVWKILHGDMDMRKMSSFGFFTPKQGKKLR